MADPNFNFQMMFLTGIANESKKTNVEIIKSRIVFRM
jgi:hypothetical protein